MFYNYHSHMQDKICVKNILTQPVRKSQRNKSSQVLMQTRTHAQWIYKIAKRLRIKLCACPNS